MRYLMRLNTLKGSGRAPTFRATASAQDRHGGEGRQRPLFLGQALQRLHRHVPVDDPQYLVLVVIDEPNPEKPAWPLRPASTPADRRQRHQPDRADAGRHAPVRRRGHAADGVLLTRRPPRAFVHGRRVSVRSQAEPAAGRISSAIRLCFTAFRSHSADGADIRAAARQDHRR